MPLNMTIESNDIRAVTSVCFCLGVIALSSPSPPEVQQAFQRGLPILRAKLKIIVRDFTSHRGITEMNCLSDLN
jgi:hypothetical protein